MVKAKALVLAVIIGITATAGTYAIGLGAQFNFDPSKSNDERAPFAPGVALAFSPSDHVHSAFNWYFGGEYTKIGLTLDWAPVDLPLAPFLGGSIDLTLGVGFFTNVTFIKHEDPEFHGGFRIPTGFTLWLADRTLEIYLHVAPSFNIGVIPKIRLYDPFFPVALGVRFWLGRY